MWRVAFALVQIPQEHVIDGAGWQGTAIAKNELGDDTALVTFGAVRVAVVGVGGEDADRFVVDKHNAPIQGHRLTANLLVNAAVAACGSQDLLIEQPIAAVHHNRIAVPVSGDKKVAAWVILCHPGHPLKAGDAMTGWG